jgi:uncharacterized membrane protein YcjF (UPF0283 family)
MSKSDDDPVNIILSWLFGCLFVVIGIFLFVKWMIEQIGIFLGWLLRQINSFFSALEQFIRHHWTEIIFSLVSLLVIGIACTVVMYRRKKERMRQQEKEKLKQEERQRIEKLEREARKAQAAKAAAEAAEKDRKIEGRRLQQIAAAKKELENLQSVVAQEKDKIRNLYKLLEGNN